MTFHDLAHDSPMTSPITSNIKPLAREMAARICRRSGVAEPNHRRWATICIDTAICYCRICGPASPASGRAPASRWSAIPPNAPTRCSNSSTPAVTRSACPAICTTRRPSVLGDLSARSWPRTIAAGWRRDPRRPAKAATHNHRCSWLRRAGPPAHFKINIGGYGSRLKAGTTRSAASATVTSPTLVQVSPPHRIPITHPRTSSFFGPATITSLA